MNQRQYERLKLKIETEYRKKIEALELIYAESKLLPLEDAEPTA